MAHSGHEAYRGNATRVSACIKAKSCIHAQDRFCTRSGCLDKVHDREHWRRSSAAPRPQALVARWRCAEMWARKSAGSPLPIVRMALAGRGHGSPPVEEDRCARQAGRSCVEDERPTRGHFPK